MNTETPRLIKGDLAADDRGQVSFVNDFTFNSIKRFYVIRNYDAGFVRAWHGHRREAKYVTVLSGAAILGAVRIDDSTSPANECEVHRYVLSSSKPCVLYIPAGYANGFKTLTTDTQLLFFSTATLQESMADDIRFDARRWDIWSVEER